LESAVGMTADFFVPFSEGENTPVSWEASAWKFLTWDFFTGGLPRKKSHVRNFSAEPSLLRAARWQASEQPVPLAGKGGERQNNVGKKKKYQKKWLN